MKAARLQTALWRRSDRDSRGMIWRRTNEAIGDQVVESNEQGAGRQQWGRDAVGERRFSLRKGQRADRHNRTILAIVALLLLRTAVHAVFHDGLTAWHVARHRRHIHRRGDSRPLCRRRGHQRRSNKPNDHKDRQQTTDESANIHGSPSHRTGDLERTTGSHSC
jgi:hypothetical protein